MTSDFEPLPEASEPLPPPNGWRREVAWGPREVIQGAALALAAVILISVTAIVVAALLGIDVTDKTRTEEIAVAAALPFEAVLFVIAASLTVFKYGSPWRDLGFRSLSKRMAWVPAALVAGAFAFELTYLNAASAIGGDKLLPNDVLKDVLDEEAFVVLAGILAVCAAPLVEETFFRGFVFGGLSKRFNFFTAALISGFLFALAHQDPTVLIPFTVIGMLFATGYAYTGSLWTSISAHFTFNLISFTIAMATR